MLKNKINELIKEIEKLEIKQELDKRIKKDLCFNRRKKDGA